MADWFTDVVDEACAEVLARQEIRDNLGRVADDRDTRNIITAQVAELRDSGMLRELHAAGANAVERIDRDREEMLTELLPRQWQAVVDAGNRVRRIELQLGADAGYGGGGGPSLPVELWDALRRGVVRMLGAVRRRNRPDEDLEARLGRELEAARDELTRAQQDFSAAAVQETIVQRPQIRGIDGRRDEALAALREELVDDLTGRINLIIDADLTDSYQREFSYAGSAWLVDRPGADAERLSAEINGQAFAEIRGRIDRGLTGAVGVAGPRGIGKTTLLSHFAGPVPDQWPRAPWDYESEVQRWGVSVAAPAQYDARDFLLHLFGTLCAAVIGEAGVRLLEDEMTGAGEDTRGIRLLASPFVSYLAAMALLCGAVVAGLEVFHPVASARSMTDLLIAGCCAVVAVVTAALPMRRLKVRASLTFLRFPATGEPLAEAADRGARRPEERMIRLVFRIRAAVVAVSGTVACALVALVATGYPPEPGYLAAAALAGAAVLAFLVLRSEFPQLELFYNRNPYAAQISAAEDWYRKVKFQQSYTTGWSGTVTLSASALPVQAQAGRSGSRAVSQVSMSIPEIVAAFTSFTDVLRSRPPQGGQPEAFEPSGAKPGAEDAPAPSPRPPIPVVIGIDEVDKIEDPRTAQAFFNQIKGLFGDANCLFLISISDDAMAAYERRGLPLRDAFDSSLSTVVALSYLTRLEARKLLGSRLVQVTEPSADLLYVLSGGLPRELVRLVRRAVDIQRDRAGEAASQEAGRKPPPVPLDDLAVTLIADQVAAQRRAVLIRGRALEPCPARDGLLAWAGDPAADAAAGDGTITSAASDVAADAGATVTVDYFDRLVATGRLLMAACDGTVPDPQAASGSRPHADGCAAQETGAFLLWLGTVGQVFGLCHDQEDFQIAERPHDTLSFERLARARQNFPLGPGYVQAAVAAVRIAWDLDRPADGAAEATPVRAVS